MEDRVITITDVGCCDLRRACDATKQRRRFKLKNINKYVGKRRRSGTLAAKQVMEYGREPTDES